MRINEEDKARRAAAKAAKLKAELIFGTGGGAPSPFGVTKAIPGSAGPGPGEIKLTINRRRPGKIGLGLRVRVFLP